SMELTFRIVPKRLTSRRGEINVADAAEPALASGDLGAERVSVQAEAAPTLALGLALEAKTQVDVEVELELEEAQVPAAQVSPALLLPESRSAIRRWILLVPAALLCAALAASATFLLASDKKSETTPAASAKTAVDAQRAAPEPTNESVVSARANAQDRAA